MKSGIMVIAEVGVNHNGKLDIAERLVYAAAEAGADAVKFQTFRAELLASASAPLATYQQGKVSNVSTQLEMLKSLELHHEHHLALQVIARSAGLEFLSTPFDSTSLDFLVDVVGLETIKVPSGEVTNYPYLIEVARRAKTIILSTGASTLNEVHRALRALHFGFTQKDQIPRGLDLGKSLTARELAIVRPRIVLMHCVTSYPAPVNESNLLALPRLANEFGLRMGLSDHSLGNHVSIAALALGATVFEKHLTLDRNMSGPDHAASLSPPEFREYVRLLRETDSALGDGVKRPQKSELGNLRTIRRSIVAIAPIRVGETYTTSNIGLRRPSGGLPASRWWDVIGEVAKRNYESDESIELPE